MKATNRNAAAEERGVPEIDRRENSLTSRPVQGPHGCRRSRIKGDRIERDSSAHEPKPGGAATSTIEALMFGLRDGLELLSTNPDSAAALRIE